MHATLVSTCSVIFIEIGDACHLQYKAGFLEIALRAFREILNQCNSRIGIQYRICSYNTAITETCLDSREFLTEGELSDIKKLLLNVSMSGTKHYSKLKLN